MKKLLSPLLFISLITSAVFSQNAKETVFLKDGSIIKGTILVYLVNDHVTIESTEGKTYTFSASEIKDIETSLPVSTTSIKSGYFNNTSFGVLIGEANYGNSLVNFTFNTINGYQFNNRLQGGLGLGLDIIYSEVILPVFFDFRYYLRKSSFSPFVGGFYGYSFQSKEKETNTYYYDYYNNNNLKTGRMYGLEVGIRNYTKENLGFTLSVGYRFQYLSTTYKDWSYNIDVLEEHFLNRFKLTMGVIFN